MITKTPFNNNNWININTDSIIETDPLYTEYEIDEEVLAYSLDENERAHLEYDKLTNTFILIFNVPNLQKIDNHYETIPITFLIKDSLLISMSNSKNEYIINKMKDHLLEEENTSIFKFLFSSLFIITDSFFPLVEEMNADRKVITDKLREKTTKQNLLSLSDLETGIVYFVAASKQNVVLLKQIKVQLIYRRLDDNEKEQFEDTLIEAKQLVEMSQLSAQFLQQLSGTHNNILNNNLNDTIKILTVLSVLLTVPTIVTGFFGMNMPLPLENNISGWIIVILISTGLWFALSYILRRIMK